MTHILHLYPHTKVEWWKVNSHTLGNFSFGWIIATLNNTITVSFQDTLNTQCGYNIRKPSYTVSILFLLFFVGHGPTINKPLQKCPFDMNLQYGSGWEECRLCRPIALSPQVVSPHRSYVAPTSKLCRPNIEVVSPQGSVRNVSDRSLKHAKFTCKL